MRVFCLILGMLVILVAAGAAWGEFEEMPLTNAGFTRVVSGTCNILKTTKLLVGETKLLDQPSVEVMIDIDYKGSLVTLIPSDFDIKKIERATKGKENETSITLESHYPGLPLRIYIDYWSDPRNQYQQKSISIEPLKAAGAVLKRVTIDSIQFPNTIKPIAPAASGFVNETKSSFAVVDAKSQKGVCFDFPSGKIALNSWRYLTAYEEMDVTLEKGYQTGRMTLGAVSGKPEVVFKSYRQILLETRYPTLAKDLKFSALRKRFGTCFSVCQYIPDDGHISAEGHIADNTGFILLFNMGSEVGKALFSLSEPALGLSGDLKLSDWTSLDKATDMGTKKLEDKLEIDVPAKGYKIIGVNIDG